jgi:hypothetical protein
MAAGVPSRWPSGPWGAAVGAPPLQQFEERNGMNGLCGDLNLDVPETIVGIEHFLFDHSF